MTARDGELGTDAQGRAPDRVSLAQLPARRRERRGAVTFIAASEGLSRMWEASLSYPVPRGCSEGTLRTAARWQGSCRGWDPASDRVSPLQSLGPAAEPGMASALAFLSLLALLTSAGCEDAASGRCRQALWEAGEQGPP